MVQVDSSSSNNSQEMVNPSSSSSSSHTEEEEMNESSQHSHQQQRNGDITIFCMEEIQLLQHLGSGTFSSVYSFRRRTKEDQLADQADFTSRTEASSSFDASDSNLEEVAEEDVDEDDVNDVVVQREATGGSTSKDEDTDSEDDVENSSPKEQEEDQVDHTEMALKRLHGRGWETKQNARQAVKDMRNELKILSSLPSQHPHLITLYGMSDNFFTKPMCAFLVLERLVEPLDRSLARWKREHSSFQLSHLLWSLPAKYLGKRTLQQQLARVHRAALGTAKALAFLHEHGYVYRDLKPENMGFDVHGTIRLFDLALAQRVLGPGGCEYCHERIGTLRYMAPEVARAERYGLQADVYSFAVLLWHVMTLEKPHKKAHDTVEMRLVVSNKELHPPLHPIASKAVQQLMMDCWKAVPHERPTMAQVVQRLQDETSTKCEPAAIDDYASTISLESSSSRKNRGLAPTSIEGYSFYDKQANSNKKKKSKKQQGAKEPGGGHHRVLHALRRLKCQPGTGGIA